MFLNLLCRFAIRHQSYIKNQKRPKDQYNVYSFLAHAISKYPLNGHV